MAKDPTSKSDPFASQDVEHTFIKPSPGGRAPTAPAAQSHSAAAPDSLDGTVPSHGLNPLLAAANPLLIVVPRLRHMRQAPDAMALRTSLVQGIRDFAATAQHQGIAPERVMAARYVLCTMLDEAASDTPWGGGGVWARHSLLAEFHNESFGGEKVFQLMARLAEKPDANCDLLELIYAAVALGFEGRYRVIDGGKAQLEAVRAKLAQLIRQQRGPYPAALAEHWQGEQASIRQSLSWLPLAVAASLSLLFLGVAYTGFAWSLSGRADPVYDDIQRVRLPPPVVPVAQPAPQPRLAQFLEADIKANLVAVRDEVDRSIITVRGDGLFAPASATLASDREALMQRIALALARVSGQVLVTGHTDNVAIRTVRFPSNWHLSEERARAVRDIMVSAGLPAERVRADGRADGDPVAPNDTPANRSLNRRVEITLLSARPEAQVRTSSPGATPAVAPASR